MVEGWWDEMLGDGKKTDTSHAYSQLKSILTTAIEEGVIPGPNPCDIDGASSLRTGIEV